jgi:hypothetical protein
MKFVARKVASPLPSRAHLGNESGRREMRKRRKRRKRRNHGLFSALVFDVSPPLKNHESGRLQIHRTRCPIKRQCDCATLGG